MDAKTEGQVLVKSIEDLTDDEIREEYNARELAPVPKEPSLDDWDSWDLLDELEDRGELPETGAVTDEILDLIAEAARSSPHAARAYDLIRDVDPEGTVSLGARQRLIQGRMKEVAA